MATYFFVAADDSRNIVTGITTNLAGAMALHKSGDDANTHFPYLVFARTFGSLHEAIEYERYFFRLSPRKRTQLLEAINPTWEDWSDDRFPAIAGMAYAEAVSDALTQWLDEDGDEPGGVGARLPFGPFDPTRIMTGSAANDLPTESTVNWLVTN